MQPKKTNLWKKQIRFNRKPTKQTFRERKSRMCRLNFTKTTMTETQVWWNATSKSRKAKTWQNDPNPMEKIEKPVKPTNLFEDWHSSPSEANASTAKTQRSHFQNSKSTREHLRVECVWLKPTHYFCSSWQKWKLAEHRNYCPLWSPIRKERE